MWTFRLGRVRETEYDKGQSDVRAFKCLAKRRNNATESRVEVEENAILSLDSQMPFIFIYIFLSPKLL